MEFGFDQTSPSPTTLNPGRSPSTPNPDLPLSVPRPSLKSSKFASASALSPSDPLAVVASIGSFLCSSEVDIVDPWDGNPTAVFSPYHFPSYLEPLPLASLHPLLCSGDDASSLSDDYSSSDEARLEAKVQNKSCLRMKFLSYSSMLRSMPRTSSRGNGE
ncbi:hypothetical protein NE237_032789 [Protea cynaroides]|uniref:Uncharacterized protein n=1 Tax=Protea cynaroides TaxID=273540 RepID=A0A9Q0L3S0_9MAGN|nr:hypothetical protein NE237_032789 [Protea cynaroides]